MRTRLSYCLTQVFAPSLIELCPLVACKLLSRRTTLRSVFRAAFEEARKLLVAPSMRVAWSPSWLNDAIRARDRAWCEYVNCAVSGDSGDQMCRVSYANARDSLSDKRHHLKRAVRQAYAKYIAGLTRDIIVSWERRQNFC